MMILKAILIWFLIAVGETLNGILRVRLLNRRFGDRRARRVAILPGSAIILAIGWVTVPWIGPASTSQALLVGALWLAMMLAFDILFGRLVFHFSWKRIAADFDITQGNLLAIGMLVVFITPLLVARLRGLC